MRACWGRGEIKQGWKPTTITPRRTRPLCTSSSSHLHPLSSISTSRNGQERPYEIFLDGANIALFGQNWGGGGFSMPQVRCVRSPQLVRVAEVFTDRHKTPPPPAPPTKPEPPPNQKCPQVKSMWDKVASNNPGRRMLLIFHQRRLKEIEQQHPSYLPWIEGLKKRRDLFATPAGSNDDWYWLYACVKAQVGAFTWGGLEGNKRAPARVDTQQQAATRPRSFEPAPTIANPSNRTNKPQPPQQRTAGQGHASQQRRAAGPHLGDAAAEALSALEGAPHRVIQLPRRRAAAAAAAVHAVRAAAARKRRVDGARGGAGRGVDDGRAGGRGGLGGGGT